MVITPLSGLLASIATTPGLPAIQAAERLFNNSRAVNIIAASWPFMFLAIFQISSF